MPSRVIVRAVFVRVSDRLLGRGARSLLLALTLPSWRAPGDRGCIPDTKVTKVTIYTASSRVRLPDRLRINPICVHISVSQFPRFRCRIEY